MSSSCPADLEDEDDWGTERCAMDGNENKNGQRCLSMCPRRWKEISVEDISNRGHLLALPDEILLLIFKALPMVDVLSPFCPMFIHHDCLASHRIFFYIRRLDLTGRSTIPSRCTDLCPTPDEVLLRLVAQTLPRLPSPVHQMNGQSDSIRAIIAAATDPLLSSSSLPFVLTDDLIFRSLCKEIRHLCLDVEFVDELKEGLQSETFAWILSSSPK